MAISAEKKQELVAGYVEDLSRSQAVILTDYRGLSVANLQQLRGRLRQSGAKYVVVKNTLIRLALQQLNMPVPEELLEGPVGIGFCFDETQAIAKLLLDFAKESKILQVKGGIMEGRVLSAEDITALTTMPPREVILAQVLGTIQAPSSRVVGAVTGVMRNILYVLKAHVEKMEAQNTGA